MKQKSKKIVVGIILVLIVIGGFIWWQVANSQPGRLDDFAKCLGDKGVIFYGAFWCPHCQNQKASFGSSKKYLPYVECSTQDSNGQLQVCIDADVKAYPTWQFADGSREEGELGLDILAEKSGCQLPE